MRPNILLIVSDQHRLDSVGTSAACPVDTPNLDSLAREGLWFGSAYTPIPLCTPARASLLTGRRPEAAGTLWNYDNGPHIPPLDPDTYAWPRELQRAGYRNHYIGKWHVNPDHDPTSFGYDGWTPLSAYNAWRAERHPEATLPPGWFGAVDPVPTEDSRTHWLADRAADFIRDGASGDQPWHLRLDFLEPHLPCQPTEEFAARYPADTIPPWPGFADRLENKPYIQRQQLVNWGVEDWSWRDWAPTVARYYAIIAQLDDAIGRVLQALDETGVASDTLVIYTSDHGDMCGSHGMMDKHYVMYDDVVRVPLIMRWPSRIAAGGRVDDFTYNTLDLPPTLAEIVDIAAPPAPHGVTLFDCTDEALGVSDSLRARDHVISTYNGQQFGLFIQRMIRTREWKYVWNPTDVDELYDMRDDPAELLNRIEDDACTEVLAALRVQLYEELLVQDDPVVANHWMRRQLLEGRKLLGSPAAPREAVG